MNIRFRFCLALCGALLVAGCEEGAKSTTVSYGLATTYSVPTASAAAPTISSIPLPGSAQPSPEARSKLKIDLRHGAIASAVTGASSAPYPTPFPGYEIYQRLPTNKVQRVAETPLSTFAASVDTASYSNVRHFLREAKRLPPAEAVRVEEMVNYFDYDYAKPRDLEERFRPTVMVYPSPWTKGAEILQIGIKGYAQPLSELPPLNLVLLVDVSGSMGSPDRLPLVQQVFTELSEILRPRDRVSIVSYANDTRLVLSSTSDKGKIRSALAGLKADGGTYGAAGLAMAYQQAEKNLDREATSRIVLATDGDFNLGISDPDKLADFVHGKQSLGIHLSVLGVGRGNYNDALAHKLAAAGKGNATYVDTITEARRALLDRMAPTLGALADDLKLQVEFNPAVVAEYRLIGYESRELPPEAFRNDKVAGGDIGPGHVVTALYEITTAEGASQRLEPSRYGAAVPPAARTGEHGDEFAVLHIRYKRPGAADSALVERPVTVRDRYRDLGQTPADARFAAAVAGFAQILRRDPAVGSWRFEDAAGLAEGALGGDPFRHDFLDLVMRAQQARDQIRY